MMHGDVFEQMTKTRTRGNLLNKQETNNDINSRRGARRAPDAHHKPTICIYIERERAYN